MEHDSMQLKKLSREAIPAALEKADKYRLLNDPRDAESICLDILEVEPGNQKAVVTLILARTDQFPDSFPPEEAKKLLPLLTDDYARSYYSGIIYERQAKAQLDSRTPGAASYAYGLLRQAMEQFEVAMSFRDAVNEEAVLRWNACVRMIAQSKLVPREEANVEIMLE